MSRTDPPALVRLSEELGPVVPERAAFEEWCARKYRSQAYLHTSATSGEWDAWVAATECERSRWSVPVAAHEADLRACVAPLVDAGMNETAAEVLKAADELAALGLGPN